MKSVKNSSKNRYGAQSRHYAILQAAETLFGEKGYPGVTVAEIARAAGVAKGLVNYHFGSKEQLLLHVLSKGTATLFSQLDAVTRTHETARERIRAAIELYLTVASAGPALTRMAMMAVVEANYPERTRQLWLAFMEKNLDRFSELVEHGVAAGELRPVDSRLVTQMVMAWAFEFLRTAALREEKLDPRDAADKVTEILFEGIGR